MNPFHSYNPFIFSGKIMLERSFRKNLGYLPKWLNLQYFKDNGGDDPLAKNYGNLQALPRVKNESFDGGHSQHKQANINTKYRNTTIWMSQEISKWLGSVGYNPNVPHLYEGYNTFTNH